ncbi:MAG TPA: hypothetical protein VFV38_26545 [Ktedonobacteraceae bacterium]|nr:hypothetical protein [Ktedonobacteraceae bacterium]
MKQPRKTAEDGKEHLLTIMHEIHAHVTTQSEFTAQRIADAAGISKVWLYHLAGEEFRTLRSTLPGSRKTRDEEVAALRQENAELRAQLKDVQEQARLASSAALKKAVIMLEQWEQENLELRGHIRVLTRRLEQAGGYIDVNSPSSSMPSKVRLKPVDL